MSAAAAIARRYERGASRRAVLTQGTDRSREYGSATPRCAPSSADGGRASSLTRSIRASTRAACPGCPEQRLTRNLAVEFLEGRCVVQHHRGSHTSTVCRAKSSQYRRTARPRSLMRPGAVQPPRDVGLRGVGEVPRTSPETCTNLHPFECAVRTHGRATRTPDRRRRDRILRSRWNRTRWGLSLRVTFGNSSGLVRRAAVVLFAGAAVSGRKHRIGTMQVCAAFCSFLMPCAGSP